MMVRDWRYGRQEAICATKKGVNGWNKWREKSPEVDIDLGEAILIVANLIKAFEMREDKEGKNILFPVTLGRYLFDTWEHECKADVLVKVVGDFSEWDKDASKYDQALDKLLQGLQAPLGTHAVAFPYSRRDYVRHLWHRDG